MRFIVSLFLSLASGVACSQDTELVQGVGVTRQNFSELARTNVALSVARSSHKATGSKAVEAFLHDEENDRVFSFYAGQIILTKYSTREVVGDWSLSSSNNCNNSNCLWQLGRWTKDEVLEKKTALILADMYGGLSFSGSFAERGFGTQLDSMGCMQHSPLRFGDFDGDGTKELIILSAQRYSIDLILFSDELKKTIFANKINVDEIANPNSVPTDLIPKYEGFKNYQFWMQSSIDRSEAAGMYPAIKSYAKLYFGSFDENGNRDILVWRKMYESRLASDPIKGFEKLSDTYAHYSLVDGEYVRRPTNENQISTWLASRNHTWVSGYPRTSECAGDEGELIQEMHDPLLNDPDVIHPPNPA